MRKIVAVALALCAGAALAQGDKPRDATDPKAKAPPVQYRSTFSDYRSFREPEAASWREVNDQVNSLGGHRGHVQKEQKERREEKR